MIPLIGLLLCVYLIFKGVEIFQIACAVKDPSVLALTIGVIAVFASIIIAALFAYFSLADRFLLPSLRLQLSRAYERL